MQCRHRDDMSRAYLSECRRSVDETAGLNAFRQVSDFFLEVDKQFRVRLIPCGRILGPVQCCLRMREGLPEVAALLVVVTEAFISVNGIGKAFGKASACLAGLIPSRCAYQIIGLIAQPVQFTQAVRTHVIRTFLSLLALMTGFWGRSAETRAQRDMVRRWKSAHTVHP